MTIREKITCEEDAMRKHCADNRNTRKNVGTRQYKGLDETTHMMNNAITVNPDPGDMRNKFNIVT